MKRIGKKEIILLLMQLTVWGVVLTLPVLAVFLASRDIQIALNLEQMLWNMLRAPLVTYFVNFYVLVPFLFLRKHQLWFILTNVILICLLNYGFFYFIQWPKNVPQIAVTGFIASTFVYFLLNLMMVGVALAVRNYMKTRQIRKQLEEEKQKNTEAELAWLKNQLNPHFLFNTLNNISSLTQIDPDAAQDSIAQLSDLMRYAMYETNKEMVPLEGEMEFMRNYIELMKLRCNEKATVDYQMNVQHEQLTLPPLLFISLIENAFKHGLSNSQPSSIRILLEERDGNITFCCDNTNFPKSDKDRSGSGIGLENTHRRLELLYPGRYSWEQALENDIYHIRITLLPKS